MPQRCSVCIHKKRQQIDRALLAHETLRYVAERFALSVWALHRHKRHLSATLMKAEEAREAAQADSLLEQLQNLQTRALAILETAEASGDLRTALGAIREARGNLELLAKLLGELKEGTTVNVLVSPAWVSLRTVILQTLEPYPEARLKIAQALGEVDHHVGG